MPKVSARLFYLLVAATTVSRAAFKEGAITLMIFDLLFLILFVEVRQEAVQQALAAMQTRPKPSLPMPSKRTSVMGRASEQTQQDSG